MKLTESIMEKLNKVKLVEDDFDDPDLSGDDEPLRSFECDWKYNLGEKFLNTAPAKTYEEAESIAEREVNYGKLFCHVWLDAEKNLLVCESTSNDDWEYERGQFTKLALSLGEELKKADWEKNGITKEYLNKICINDEFYTTVVKYDGKGMDTGNVFYYDLRISGTGEDW